MYGDLKLTFIQQSLSQYMQSVMEGMRIAAQRNKVGVTEDGIHSLAYQVAQQGEGAVANLSFKEYLRMVDMGAGRGHPLGGLSSMRVALQSTNKTGFAQVKDKGRKPKKIYATIAYGKLTWLENKLLHGYTEETIALLKNQLQENGINPS
jgi:hypothetical protein